MEQQIKDYELQVAAILKRWHKLSTAQQRGWRRYHAQMLRDFQHERAIHLAITLFFAALTLLVLGITTWGLVISGYFWAGLWPMLVATLLLIVVTAFYIKHYYFLENHIQKLYRHNIEFCLEGKAS